MWFLLVLLMIYRNKSPPKKKIRNTAKIFGLGDTISIIDTEITGSRLSTCRQVIRCYMYIQELQISKHQCKTKYEMAKTVAN